MKLATVTPKVHIRSSVMNSMDSVTVSRLMVDDGVMSVFLIIGVIRGFSVSVSFLIFFVVKL